MASGSSRQDERERFLDAWAAMAALFSFSPSTSKVAGLVLTSGEPLTAAEIAEALSMSRGNVSMCLKELRGWGVLRKISRPGERRDFYAAQGDLFAQMVSIARERKRRDFDPFVGIALESLANLREGASNAERTRLDEVATHLDTIDRVARELLDAKGAAAALMTLLGGLGEPPDEET